jgi:hypothetical protein
MASWCQHNRKDKKNEKRRKQNDKKSPRIAEEFESNKHAVPHNAEMDQSGTSKNLQFSESTELKTTKPKGEKDEPEPNRKMEQHKDADFQIQYPGHRNNIRK